MTLLDTETRIDEQYILAGHWLSDLKFFENELNFFAKLLERNILFLGDEEYLDRLAALKRELTVLAADNIALYVSIVNHREEITLERKHRFDPALSERDAKHETLHRRLADMTVRYRKFKLRLFAEIAFIMEKTEEHEQINN